jgi:hypothetical protein
LSRWLQHPALGASGGTICFGCLAASQLTGLVSAVPPHRRFVSAAKLPAHGGAMELTSLDEISAAQVQ